MTRNDRLTPCACCKFPLTQEHHLLQRKDWGDNKNTIRLCATCHELFHLLYRCYVDESESSRQVAGQLILKLGPGNERVGFIYNLVQHAKSLEEELSRQILEQIIHE